MACTPEYIDFVCSQLAPIGQVRARKMMGDYVIYVDEKCVITACDNQCYVKQLPEVAKLMTDAERGVPYEGAKEHFILDIEHGDQARRIVTLLRDLLPYPKRKKASATKGAPHTGSNEAK